MIFLFLSISAFILYFYGKKILEIQKRKEEGGEGDEAGKGGEQISYMGKEREEEICESIRWTRRDNNV
jgi:hypothetical protein